MSESEADESLDKATMGQSANDWRDETRLGLRLGLGRINH